MTPASEGTPGRRFELVAKLGAGAFGEVLLAEMEGGGGFRRKVALKLLHPDMERHADVARRMRDEARVLGRLAHRHIVAVLDLVRLDDRWAIVMDYVPGADLDHVLMATEREGQAVPAPAAVDITIAVLRALHAASHAIDDDGQGLEVVHRDIKPSNVRLTADGDVKVLDFGVARFHHQGREANTRAEGWIGTELYMAPERILCEGDTPAGDVYATGATLVELLLAEQLGRTPVRAEPHQALVEGAVDKVRAVLDGPTDAVDGVLELLRRMLHVDPTARPTAEVAADTLEAHCRQLHGESLTAFARRVVPGAEQIALSGQEPAEGMLVERGSTNNTLAIEGYGGLRTPPSSLNERRVLVALGGAASLALIAAVSGLAILGVAGWMLLRAAPEPDTTVVVPDAAPVEAAPVEVEPTTPDVETVQAPRALAPVPVEAEEPATEPPPVGAARRPQPEVAPLAADPDVPPPPRVSRAQFAVRDAEAVAVTCGDVAAQGTATLRITEFPAGTCVVEATYLGRRYRTRGTLDTERAIQCVVEQGALSCSW